MSGFELVTLGLTAQHGVHGAIEASDGRDVFGELVCINSFGLPGNRPYQDLNMDLRKQEAETSGAAKWSSFWL